MRFLAGRRMGMMLHPSPERLTPQMRNGLGTAEEEVDK